MEVSSGDPLNLGNRDAAIAVESGVEVVGGTPVEFQVHGARGPLVQSRRAAIARSDPRTLGAWVSGWPMGGLR